MQYVTLAEWAVLELRHGDRRASGVHRRLLGQSSTGTDFSIFLTRWLNHDFASPGLEHALLGTMIKIINYFKDFYKLTVFPYHFSIDPRKRTLDKAPWQYLDL